MTPSTVILWSRRILAPLILMGLVALVAVSWEQGTALAADLGVRIVVAVIIGLIGLAFAGGSWALLSETGLRNGLATFGSTLPLRHLPMGGLGQVVGLSGVAVVAGSERRKAFVAAPAFLVTIATGAGFLALPILFSATPPLWIKLIVGAGAGAGIVLILMGDALLARLFSSWIRPDQTRRFPLPLAVAVLSMVGTSAAFAALFPFSGSFGSVLVGFSAAWLCGFVFVISPAGLGAREAALLLMFPDVDTSVVIATALAHRLTTLVAELVLFAVAWWLSRDWGTRITRRSE